MIILLDFLVITDHTQNKEQDKDLLGDEKIIIGLILHLKKIYIFINTQNIKPYLWNAQNWEKNDQVCHLGPFGKAVWKRAFLKNSDFKMSVFESRFWK